MGEIGKKLRERSEDGVKCNWDFRLKFGEYQV